MSRYPGRFFNFYNLLFQSFNLILKGFDLNLINLILFLKISRKFFLIFKKFQNFFFKFQKNKIFFFKFKKNSRKILFNLKTFVLYNIKFIFNEIFLYLKLLQKFIVIQLNYNKKFNHIFRYGNKSWQDQNKSHLNLKLQFKVYNLIFFIV